MSCSSSLGRRGEEGCLVCGSIPPIIDLSRAAVVSPSLAEAQLCGSRGSTSWSLILPWPCRAPTCSSLIPCTEPWRAKPPVWQLTTGVGTWPTGSVLWFNLFYCGPWDVNLHHQTFFFLFSQCGDFCLGFLSVLSLRKEN